ncbi:hypothetical protein [Dermacoccus nishinomiyaensis]|uniref:hypothetical protein n=1 Tax=Dermacoccus nishinomiyaensis TaxID=1274 RepID=UPI001EF5117D|nr:hypothetical protein [Dermacoccus nishinomiyaensis]MCG7429393.1 hypothetical protein [Dermacoccus nishinomiyaensis]
MNETYDGEVPPPWDEPVAPLEPVVPVHQGGQERTGIEPDSQVLDDLRAWFARFVTVLHDRDLDLGA